MTRKRKTHSAFKPKVAPRLCAKGRPVTAGPKYSAPPFQIHARKKQLLAGLPAVFRAPRTRRAEDEAALVPELYAPTGPITPNSPHRVYPHLLRGIVDRPDQVWCSDIDCLPMPSGFIYLVAVWTGSAATCWPGGLPTRSTSSRRTEPSAGTRPRSRTATATSAISPCALQGNSGSGSKQASSARCGPVRRGPAPRRRRG